MVRCPRNNATCFSVFYKGNGTPAVFSDMFRVGLLRQGVGIYIDLDMLLVAPVEENDGYLIAQDSAHGE